MLSLKTIESIVAEMDAIDKSDLLEVVCEEVSNSYHIKHYNERGHQWSEVMEWQEHLQELIQLTTWVCIDNQKMCAKGRKTFDCLQLEWMRLIRSIMHEQKLAADSSAT